MRAVVAATDLVLEEAASIFRAGWYEEGRAVTADGERRGALADTAERLRALGSRKKHARGESLRDSGHHRHRLAEWEVSAVDARVRESVKSLFTKDWGRIHHDPRLGYQTSPGGGAARSSAAASPRPHDETVASPHPPPPPPPPGLHSPKARDSSNTSVTSPRPSSTRRSSPPDPTPDDAPRTPPQSPPSSPNVRHGGAHGYGHSSRALLSKRDRLLVTAPAMPVMPTHEPPHPPAPPLSPTPSASSHRSASSSLSLPSINSSSSSVPSHHRPSAAERRRTVAACRALRAQITRFEDSFVGLHGRAPKGAAERAPLATTYAQYREWKRAIRADAARRIQALARGAGLRNRVARHAGGGVSRARWRAIVSAARRRRRLHNTDGGESTLPLIPVEIGDGPGGVPDVEVVISPTEQQHESFQQQPQPQRPSLSTSSSSNAKRPWGIRPKPSPPPTTSPGPSPSPRGTVPTSAATPNHTADAAASLAEFQAEKRNLKNLLKKYDMDFYRKNNRMPVKSEKEPIRHLYEKYNGLKSRIESISGGSSVSDSTTQRSIGSVTARTGEESRGGGSSSRSSRRPRSGSGGSSGGGGGGSVSATPHETTSSPVVSSDRERRLERLRAEKTELHQMLRSYERDFFRENNRNVSSFVDIRPVAGQYRRYKEIKKSIAALQGESGGGDART